MRRIDMTAACRASGGAGCRCCFEEGVRGGQKRGLKRGLKGVLNGVLEGVMEGVLNGFFEVGEIIFGLNLRVSKAICNFVLVLVYRVGS